MFRPIKVMDVEFSRPLEDIEGLDEYRAVMGLVRFQGTPIGYITLPLHDGRCTALDLSRAIVDQHGTAIARHLLRNRLAGPLQPDRLGIDDLFSMSPPAYDGPQPLVTVAVCTRDRTADLALCLESVSRLDYPALDILVVDNAPSSDATERLVRSTYPAIRYVCEPRPGLNWARNRAIVEARAEIIAYTDDDVVIDPGWVSALARVFVENPEVMAVTGLVAPYELETEPQMFFEQYGGFGRGFERRWYRLDRENGRRETYHIHAGGFGTGANMAYRRTLFGLIGGFDPGLDVGTVTNGGGDLEMFFRVLEEGHTLVYEPSAVVRHRHRRDYASLQTQITNWGIGVCAFLVRSALAYPGKRLSIIHLGLWRNWYWNIRRLMVSLFRPPRFPRALILAFLWGFILGPLRYRKARRCAGKIARTVGPLPLGCLPTEMPCRPLLR